MFPLRLAPFAALLFATLAGAQQPQPVPPQTPAPQAGVAAQAVPAAAPAPTAATVDADPALWVVKDKDTTIYLFGTIHVLKPGLSWFDEAVRTAFDKSSELRLEMVLPGPAEAQAAALKAGTLPAGQTLTTKLPEAARRKYIATLNQYGIPETALDRFAPWFAANNLTVLPLMKLGYKLDEGAEKVLTRAATEEGKTITGFETLPEQLGYFAALSEKAQVNYLTSVVDELPKVATTVDSMVGDWWRGDPDALAKLLNDDLNDNPELAKVLLYQRNAKWADWIKARMARPGTVFIAVGAGHLAGKDSVQALLAKRGVTATRVTY